MSLEIPLFLLYRWKNWKGQVIACYYRQQVAEPFPQPVLSIVQYYQGFVGLEGVLGGGNVYLAIYVWYVCACVYAMTW